jgi:hypothetical protein
MNRDSMKNLYSVGGEKRFAKVMINKINEGKITAENFSLKALYEAMGEPNLKKSNLIEERVITDDVDFSEALHSSAFPKITGALINKVVQGAYELAGGVADQLVTVIPSSVKDETIVGFGDDNVLQEVPEGFEYQEGSITEKYHKIYNTKKGRIISLTEEMVKFDQTGQMILRAKRVGEAAKSDRERTIFNAVLELTSTGIKAAWRPAGVATSLYSGTSNDPYTPGTLDNLGSEGLSDETDLDTAMVLFSKFTDEQGLPMVVNPNALLTGLSLKSVSNQICYSGQAVKLTTPQGTKNIYSGTMALQTPFIDQLLSVTAWFYGDFKKQFVYTEVFPLQVLQAKPGNDQEFERDIIFRFKARYMGGCGAVTNRYVVKGNV